MEAVLSAAVQTGSLELLTGCLKRQASEGNTSYVGFMLYILFSLKVLIHYFSVFFFLKGSQDLLLIYGLFLSGRGTK